MSSILRGHDHPPDTDDHVWAPLGVLLSLIPVLWAMCWLKEWLR